MESRHGPILYFDAQFYPGGDNNIAVIMGRYQPNVRCRGNFESAGSCKDLLADMPASTKLEVFGPRETPFVEEVVPLEKVSRMQTTKCRTTSSLS